MQPHGLQAFDFLQRTFHLQGTSLFAALQIGMPPTSVTLSASLSGQIDKTTTFTGSLRLLFGEQGVMVSLLGDVAIMAQNRPLTFSDEMDITPQGAYFEGSMQGSWVNAFDIRNLTLSNLAMVLGINWEGIPTLGLAGTLTLQVYQGAMAVLFDSVTPSKSLLAGSVSDIRLDDIYRIFVDGSIRLPQELEPIIKEIGLLGIPLFTLPRTLASDLDKETISPAIAQAFSAARWALPDDPKQMLLVTGRPEKTWYLTDHTTLRHYTIAQSKDQLQVTLQVQLAIVPQMTRLGKFTYPQGIRLAGNAKILTLDASVMVEVNTKNGLDLEGSLKPIDLGEIFQLTGANGRSEPQISLATYDAPISRYRGPHCVVSGAVTILGCTRDLDLSITRDGISITMGAKVFNVFQTSLTAQCPLRNFSHAEFSIEANMQNDLFVFLKTKGTAAITQYAQAATASIFQAQSKVSDAQRQVNSLNIQISTQTTTIQGERATAQRALNDAQSQVDTIQGSIGGKQKRIDQLKREISSLEDEIKRKPWLAFSDGANITAKESEIAGLEMDILGEQDALETATRLLNLCKRAVATTPIEADPRVASLYLSLKTATVLLQVANTSLEGVKLANARMAAAGSWLTQYGSDQLVVITHASFAGQLKELSKGSVSMSIDLTLIGRPYHINQGFNFYDLDATAASFVDQLKQLV